MRSNSYKPRKAVYGGQWPRVRKQILERDNHTCQIALPGCTVAANTVDHIQPVALGGAWYDADNLRAACKHCNGELAKIAQKVTRNVNKTMGTTTVVASRQW